MNRVGATTKTQTLVMDALANGKTITTVWNGRTYTVAGARARRLPDDRTNARFTELHITGTLVSGKPCSKWVACFSDLIIALS